MLFTKQFGIFPGYKLERISAWRTIKQYIRYPGNKPEWCPETACQPGQSGLQRRKYLPFVL